MVIEHFPFSPMLRRDLCPSDDELLEVTEHRHIYDAKKPAEVCIYNDVLVIGRHHTCICCLCP